MRRPHLCMLAMYLSLGHHSSRRYTITVDIIIVRAHHCLFMPFEGGIPLTEQCVFEPEIAVEPPGLDASVLPPPECGFEPLSLDALILPPTGPDFEPVCFFEPNVGARGRAIALHVYECTQGRRQWSAVQDL